MAIENELLDSQTPTEEATDPSQIDLERVQKVEETNKKLFARAKSAEEELKKLREIVEQRKQEEPVDYQKKEATLSVEDLLSFRRKGLSDEEIAEAVDRAKGLGIPVTKFVESDVLEPWVEKMRSSKKAEQATLTPSARSFVSGGKTFDEIVSSGDVEATRKAAEQLLAQRLSGQKDSNI